MLAALVIVAVDSYASPGETLTVVGGVSAVICAAGKTTGVLAAAKACPSAGVLVSIFASEVLPVV